MMIVSFIVLQKYKPKTGLIQIKNLIKHNLLEVDENFVATNLLI